MELVHTGKNPLLSHEEGIRKGGSSRGEIREKVNRVVALA